MRERSLGLLFFSNVTTMTVPSGELHPYCHFLIFRLLQQDVVVQMVRRNFVKVVLPVSRFRTL